VKDFLFVAEACLKNIETIISDEALRNGKLKWTRFETFWKCELESGCFSGFPWIDPVGMPCVINLEIESDGKNLAGSNRAVAGDEARFYRALEHRF